VYPDWRGRFYPKGLPHRRELEYLSHRVRTVEINGSFYSLQRPQRYQGWRDQAPDDFVFAVKGGRFITHVKRLRDIHSPLANFMASGVLALGATLGPILWQLPPTLAFDPALLTAFFDLLPYRTGQAARLAREHDERLDGREWTTTDVDRPLRHALEVRHPSFHDSAFVKLVRRYGIALVIADTAGKWPRFDEVTAEFVYVRLHGSQELYTSGYTDHELDSWAATIRRWRRSKDVFIYFDNDVEAHAPTDAMALARRVAR